MSSPAVSVDSAGNANFSGTLTVGRLSAGVIDGFDELKNSVNELVLTVENLKNQNRETAIVETYNSLAPLESGEVAASVGGENIDKYDVEQNFPMLGVVLEKEEDVVSSSSLKYNLILFGKTKVKVTAENGPIKIGDILAPGKVPGTVVKAVGPGMVIGTALESFEEESLLNPEGEHVYGSISAVVNPHWYVGQITEDGVFAGSEDVKTSLWGDLTLAVKESLAKLGLFIESGIVKVTGIISETITAKKAQFDVIELKDKKTGEIYCTWMQDGAMISVKGNCTDIEDAATQVDNTEETNTPPVDVVPVLTDEEESVADDAVIEEQTEEILDLDPPIPEGEESVVLLEETEKVPEETDDSSFEAPAQEEEEVSQSEGE